MIQIYHNNRCSKSRECLAILEKSGQDFEIIKYLENVPTLEELTEIVRKLQIKPIDLVRRNEKIWVENFKDKKLSDDEILMAMISNPILIERPIVVNGEKAVIARPMEKIADLL